MPKLNCICDETINLSPLPNPQGFKLISESGLEALVEGLERAHEGAASAMDFQEQAYQLVYSSRSTFVQIYECPRCGRLAIFSRASDAIPALWYQRELVLGEGIDSVSSLLERNES